MMVEEQAADSLRNPSVDRFLRNYGRHLSKRENMILKMLGTMFNSIELDRIQTEGPKMLPQPNTAVIKCRDGNIEGEIRIKF